MCRFIFDRDGPAPTHVIVHRDGRFLPGEADDLIDALARLVPTFARLRRGGQAGQQQLLERATEF